jgi:hypothetical protein
LLLSPLALLKAHSQLREDNLFHPFGLRFRNFFHGEINYKIHDKELLTIVDAFEEWCHIFDGALVYFNCKNL